MSYPADFLDEVDPDPLGDPMLNYLINLDNEEDYLDFKESLSISRGSAFPKTAKDIFAFANRGGGWIIAGLKPRPKDLPPPETTMRNYALVGVPDDYDVDQASLQQKFNAYCASPIVLRHVIFTRNVEGIPTRFAAIYVPPSTQVLVPLRDGVYYLDEKPVFAFKGGTIFFRRGTQSVPASEPEVAWIKQRCQKTQYKLSVLSGSPDYIDESLYTNLLPVSRIPSTVTTASLIPGALGPLSALREGPDNLPCIVQGKTIVVLGEIPVNGSVWNLVDRGSVTKQQLAEWIMDEERRQIVTRILNNTLVELAQKRGLLSSREKMYFPCFGLKRTKTWKTRFRERSEKTVGVRMLARQLHRYVWVHPAIETRFVWVSGSPVLKLTPTFIITSNGERASFGPGEGTIITRLTNRMHNHGYLDSLFFWIAVLSESDKQGKIEVVAGSIIVDSRLISAGINVGIQSDRPVSEQRKVTTDESEELSR